MVTFKVLYWQVRKRYTKKPLKINLRSGANLLIESGTDATGYWYFELPDYEEQMFLLNNLRVGDLFIDVGANIGGWSLLMAGVGARVLAFEPVPSTFNKLVRNININPDLTENIEVHQLALGSHDCFLTFISDKDTCNRVLKEEEEYDGETINVVVKTLDSFTSDREPVAIKIDVEGSELNVLRGAEKTLSKPSLKFLIIETFRHANFNTFFIKELEGLLGRHGFLPCKYDSRNSRLRTFTKVNEGGQNTIYARFDKK